MIITISSVATETTIKKQNFETLSKEISIRQVGLGSSSVGVTRVWSSNKANSVGGKKNQKVADLDKQKLFKRKSFMIT